MIHAYHFILPMYGFWLPNDPRGSWSDFVRKWEIARFGKATIQPERHHLDSLSQDEIDTRKFAREKLKYPAVSIDGKQALAIAHGFSKQVLKSNYGIWACSILPEHTHLVIARHQYKIEQMANLLKGASTSQIIDEGLHPLAVYAKPGLRPPRMWSAKLWKVFLDSEEAIEEAIHYVEQNPIKEGKSPQNWSFVKRFEGIATGGWTTYH